MALGNEIRAVPHPLSGVPPSNQTGYTSLQSGMAAFRAHRWSDAIRWFDSAINQISQPGSLATAYVNRGSAYCALGRFDQAKDDYEKAIRTVPTEPEIYRAAGFEMFRAGRDADASAYFERGMKLPITPAPFLNTFAWFLATCPDKSFRGGRTAITLAERACQMTHWNNPLYIDTLAAAEAEAGNFASAIKHEQQVLASPKLTAKQRTNAETRLRKFEQHQPFYQRPELFSGL